MAWGIGGIPRPGIRPSAKPMLYLDIDGVLNPERPSRLGESVDHLIGRLTVRLSPHHREWLAELGERYELVWASTWEEHANTYIAPLLGLPELPYVALTAYRYRPDDPPLPVTQLPQMRKWAPILRHADGRRFAWLDDIIPLRARRQALPHRGILLVPVHPADGLRRRHVDRLLNWRAAQG
ncbi:HAD domain-containing protein [Actinomadura sp. WMMA1423]|uniref:HAD domain-containing protein n=1 Tax=Actinomadura sp. WMMA1423 TaxID=2591108 RepID=UPI001147262B|nr:HAD domain-containing protein [Actinomadura sp. WMMA1423]